MFRAKCVRPRTQAFLPVRPAELHSAVLGERRERQVDGAAG